jgi:hypothetical protein
MQVVRLTKPLRVRTNRVLDGSLGPYQEFNSPAGLTLRRSEVEALTNSSTMRLITALDSIGL